MITQEELKKLFRYDPSTGNFIRLTTVSNKKAGSIAGSKDINTGYITIQINRTSYRAHRLAFLYQLGRMPADQVDHINRVRDDNRWDNLREVSSAANQRNKANSLTKQSGFTHITTRSSCVSWTVRLGKSHGEKYLGAFKSLDLAIVALEQGLLDVQDSKALDRFYKEKEEYEQSSK